MWATGHGHSSSLATSLLLLLSGPLPPRPPVRLWRASSRHERFTHTHRHQSQPLSSEQHHLCSPLRGSKVDPQSGRGLQALNASPSLDCSRPGGTALPSTPGVGRRWGWSRGCLLSFSLACSGIPRNTSLFSLSLSLSRNEQVTRGLSDSLQ